MEYIIFCPKDFRQLFDSQDSRVCISVLYLSTMLVANLFIFLKPQADSFSEEEYNCDNKEQYNNPSHVTINDLLCPSPRLERDTSINTNDDLNRNS